MSMIVMRIIVRWSLIAIFAGICAVSGAALENHRALKLAKAKDADPIAIIGFSQCHALLGIVVVTQDGAVHGFPGVSPEQAVAMANALPAANSTVANAPCADLST